MKSELAINGGKPIRTSLFPDQNTLGVEEMMALNRVIMNGRPSGYRANYGEHFYGGPEIKRLRSLWAEFLDVVPDHITPCNSATSGLFIACKAIDLQPGDEVIVTPWSMTCSATIPLWFGAKPVFVDVEPDCFCIDPKSVEKAITPKTKAIIAVDIFGQPCDYDALHEIIKKQPLKTYLITDAAQAPGAEYYSKKDNRTYKVGKLSDITIFSFNFGKHMTCGEGGLVVSKNNYLATKCHMIMNHGESTVNDMYDQEAINNQNPHINSIGLNLRMTEFQAAVAIEQLKKLENNIDVRIENVNCLNDSLRSIPAITPAKIRMGCKHVYYVAAYLWDEEVAKIDRNEFIDAVKAELTPRKGRIGEGIQIGCGYIKPIYKMPLFFGTEQSDLHLQNVEDLWRNKLFLTLYHAPNSTVNDMKSISMAFNKVWNFMK